MNLLNTVNNSESFSSFNASLTSGTTTSGLNMNITTSDLTGYSWYSGYHWPCNGSCCHTTYVTSPANQTEKAYQVVRALMKAKVLKITDLTKFFDAMDEVIKVL